MAVMAILAPRVYSQQATSAPASKFEVASIRLGCAPRRNDTKGAPS